MEEDGNSGAGSDAGVRDAMAAAVVCGEQAADEGSPAGEVPEADLDNFAAAAA